MPEGGCDPMESPRRSRLLAEPATPWGTHAGAVCSQRIAPRGKGPTLEQFTKNCSPWEGLILEQFVEDCLPREGPHAGGGRENWE